MSYLTTYARRPRVTPLAGGVTALVQRGSTAVQAAGSILLDPALPEVTRLVLELRGLTKAEPTVPGQPAAAGVGLQRVVKPLRLYVYSRKHAWVLPAMVAGILGGPFVLGYLFGKTRRRAR
jgi:hypothetical protein